MNWVPIATGIFASQARDIEGPVRVVVGLPAIVELMRDKSAEPSIIVTNVAGGSAVSTIIRHAKGIVSTIGGPMSHIVVVARDYEVPCIVGASALDLAVLKSGTQMRMRQDGTVEIWQSGVDVVPDDQLRLLRLVCFAGAFEDASHIIGFGDGNIDAALASLASAGLIDNDGAITPTAEGMAALARWYSSDRALIDAATQHALHEEFRPLDRELKRVASAWQDASSRDDWNGRMAAVEALTKLHEGTLELTGKHIAAVPRFVVFRDRLGDALEKVLDGDTSFFVGVNVDSYHTIWSQFHEDLLRLLQLERDPND